MPSFSPRRRTRLRVFVAPHTKGTFTLSTPGLYHLYNKRTAYVNAYQEGEDVVRTRPSAFYANAADAVQAWIVVPGVGGVPIDAHMNVPNGADLFSPPVVAIKVDGSVFMHNYDDAVHNIITDVNTPLGAAFELYGRVQEPATHGAERRLTLTQPGLYHIYCSMHAITMGQAGQWSAVGVRDSYASGYKAHNAMEGWIIVEPAGSSAS